MKNKLEAKDEPSLLFPSGQINILSILLCGKKKSQNIRRSFGSCYSSESISSSTVS